MNKNNFLKIFSVTILLGLWFGSLAFSAKVELEISKQAGRKMDMAIAPFKMSGATGLPRLFEDTIKFDLDQSGFFEINKNSGLIQSTAEMETPSSITQGPKWKALGADIVVKAIYSWNGQSGTLELYAFTVEEQQRVFGKKYSFTQNTLLKTAHSCANDLVYRLTGENGIAGTRIAYIAGGLRSKEVFICDSDGKNVRQMTKDGSIVLGVSWHPSGNKIMYTSFKNGQARIYIHDLSQGQRQMVMAYPGLNAAAKFSPDGSKIAWVLSKDGNPEIYIGDLQGQSLQRITNQIGVDSSPCWSPDGTKLAFMSDRSGRPHLYMYDLKAGMLKRLTRYGSYNSAPSWSPDGRKIAFSSDMDGGFKICVLDLASETITIVSQEGGEAEEPDWAPDSRHIIYSSRVGGVYQLFIVDTYDGKTVRLSSSNVNYLTPAWSN